MINPALTGRGYCLSPLRGLINTRSYSGNCRLEAFSKPQLRAAWWYLLALGPELCDAATMALTNPPWRAGRAKGAIFCTLIGDPSIICLHFKRDPLPRLKFSGRRVGAASPKVQPASQDFGLPSGASGGLPRSDAIVNDCRLWRFCSKAEFEAAGWELKSSAYQPVIQP